MNRYKLNAGAPAKSLLDVNENISCSSADEARMTQEVKDALH
jgi:hypothetical protein